MKLVVGLVLFLVGINVGFVTAGLMHAAKGAVRVSMGTVFQVPWGQLGETPADWPEKGMDILHSLGFKTAAMALSDRSYPFPI